MVKNDNSKKMQMLMMHQFKRKIIGVLIIAILSYVTDKYFLKQEHKFEISLHIKDIPIDKVWEKLIDFNNYRTWQTETPNKYVINYIVDKNINVNPQQLKIGDIIKENTIWNGKQIKAKWNVTNVIDTKYNKSFTMETTKPWIGKSSIKYHITHDQESESDEILILFLVEQQLIKSATPLGKLLLNFIISTKLNEKVLANSVSRFVEQIQACESHDQSS